MPEELRSKFRNSVTVLILILKKEYVAAINSRQRPKIVIENPLSKHITMCMENSSEIDRSFNSADLLKEEIDFRVRVYAR